MGQPVTIPWTSRGWTAVTDKEHSAATFHSTHTTLKVSPSTQSEQHKKGVFFPPRLAVLAELCIEPETDISSSGI